MSHLNFEILQYLIKVILFSSLGKPVRFKRNEADVRPEKELRTSQNVRQRQSLHRQRRPVQRLRQQGQHRLRMTKSKSLKIKHNRHSQYKMIFTVILFYLPLVKTSTQ